MQSTCRKRSNSAPHQVRLVVGTGVAAIGLATALLLLHAPPVLLAEAVHQPNATHPQNRQRTTLAALS